MIFFGSPSVQRIATAPDHEHVRTDVSRERVRPGPPDKKIASRGPSTRSLPAPPSTVSPPARPRRRSADKVSVIVSSPPPTTQVLRPSSPKPRATRSRPPPTVAKALQGDTCSPSCNSSVQLSPLFWIFLGYPLSLSWKALTPSPARPAAYTKVAVPLASAYTPKASSSLSGPPLVVKVRGAKPPISLAVK